MNVVVFTTYISKYLLVPGKRHSDSAISRRNCYNSSKLLYQPVDTHLVQQNNRERRVPIISATLRKKLCLLRRRPKATLGIAKIPGMCLYCCSVVGARWPQRTARLHV